MDDIRSQCDELIANEKIDKAIALGMLRVLHSMECLQRESEHSRQLEVNELTHQLSILKMQNKTGEIEARITKRESEAKNMAAAFNALNLQLTTKKK